MVARRYYEAKLAFESGLAFDPSDERCQKGIQRIKVEQEEEEARASMERVSRVSLVDLLSNFWSVFNLNYIIICFTASCKLWQYHTHFVRAQQYCQECKFFP